MPDSDPSHTASRDPRKDELASLFREWDARGSAMSMGGRGIVVRAAITLLLAVIAGAVMFATASSFAFWSEPSTPRDLGDLRARFGGDVSLAPDNGHVALRGLVPTRLVAVAETTGAKAASGYLYFCPIANVVVYSATAVVLDPSATPDPRLDALVRSGLALPVETAASATATGRLVRGDAAPSELVPFVKSFAQRVQQTPSGMWLLLDGASPRDATWALVVWLLAGAAPLLSLIFLVRAWRHRPQPTR